MRATLYFTQEQMTGLDKLRAIRGTSRAALIREAIERFIVAEETHEDAVGTPGSGPSTDPRLD